MTATRSPRIGEGVFYAKPAFTYTTDQPYGPGTRRVRRAVTITRPAEQLVATVVETRPDGTYLIHVEGGGLAVVAADALSLTPPAMERP